MLRRAALGCVLVLVGAAAAGDAASDAARAEVARERRLLAADNARLADVTRRLETAISDLAAAVRASAEGAARGDGPDESVRREDAVANAEQDVRGLLDRRRLLADRVIDRRRRIALLDADSQGRRENELLTGKWNAVVDPGGERGVFRLNLQGTIVSGEYTLEGGSSGSFRGTLVEDRLRLERVDSKLGFNAIFYGRLSRDGRDISGTWEATTFGTGEAGSGRWHAAREEDREE